MEVNMKICEYHKCDNEANYGNLRFCSKKCKSKYHVRQTRYNNKLKAVALLGGKCKRCGYDKHPAALQFHHKLDKKTLD